MPSFNTLWRISRISDENNGSNGDPICYGRSIILKHNYSDFYLASRNVTTGKDFLFFLFEKECLEIHFLIFFYYYCYQYNYFQIFPIIHMGYGTSKERLTLIINS